jgi:hypothetical protein
MPAIMHHFEFKLGNLRFGRKLLNVPQKVLKSRTASADSKKSESNHNNQSVGCTRSEVGKEFLGPFAGIARRPRSKPSGPLPSGPLRLNQIRVNIRWIIRVGRAFARSWHYQKPQPRVKMAVISI